ncbi:MAG TPA: hypothetical protein VMH00_11485 [Candidatus Limnocylindrales bacterium]|nr:hypothetical protein [Candidatus Limnocylindrales bacterium]
MKRLDVVTMGFIIAVALAIPFRGNLPAQQQKIYSPATAKDARPENAVAGSEPWGGKKAEFLRALSSNVVSSPKITASRPAPTHTPPNIAALLAEHPATTATAKPLQPQVGASQPMSATGRPGSPSQPSSSASQNVRNQRGGAVASPIVAEPAVHTEICPQNSYGISSIDNEKTPPVGPAPAWNPIVIQGCGFGDAPGQAWLTGVHYQSVATRRPNQSFSIHPDWVELKVYQNRWTNGLILLCVDPNASGYYETDGSVTLVVTTAKGERYQATGLTFLPNYATKHLDSIPQNLLTTLMGASDISHVSVTSQGVVALAKVNDAQGHPVETLIYSPSDGSGLLPGHTLAVVREAGSAPFQGGTDSYDFTGKMWIDSVQLFHANLTTQSCSSLFPWSTGVSTNGNWNFQWTGSPVKFNLSWQEQSCGYAVQGQYVVAGVSIYALDLDGNYPVGTDPWGTGQP